jgi:hypothetical protein
MLLPLVLHAVMQRHTFPPSLRSAVTYRGRNAGTIQRSYTNPFSNSVLLSSMRPRHLGGRNGLAIV